jgi:predicted DNA-binding transcriptional regulator AlpA
MPETNNDLELIDIAEVCRLVCHGKTAVMDWVRAGEFPAPIRLSPKGRLLWYKHEVMAWLASRPRVR